MKKIIIFSIALMLLGQIIGKYAWFLGTVIGFVGLIIPLLLWLLVLTVAAVRKGEVKE